MIKCNFYFDKTATILRAKVRQDYDTARGRVSKDVHGLKRTLSVDQHHLHAGNTSAAKEDESCGTGGQQAEEEGKDLIAGTHTVA